MKNNWVRLIAGALASVVLVGAISLTGGMKKGHRTDGLLYEASGLHPDAELLRIDGQTVTAEEYLYWLAYDCEYLSNYVPNVDWNAEITAGVTYGDYAKTEAVETVKLYSVVRAWAQEADVTLTEGKFHQVKRMFAAVGHPLTALKRLEIGGVRLDEALAEGEFRPLTEAELKHLKKITDLED